MEATRVGAMRSRWVRTPVLFVGGVVLSHLVARVWAPHWPGFCADITVQKPCAVVGAQTMTGYLLIALGIIVMIMGPIVGSLIQLARHGHEWETPRGTETVITNLPILVGFLYVIIGGTLAATA